MGPDQRSARQAVRSQSEIGQDLLDRLSQGDFDEAEDRDLPRLAVGRGCRRCAPSPENICIETAIGVGKRTLRLSGLMSAYDPTTDIGRIYANNRRRRLRTAAS